MQIQWKIYKDPLDPNNTAAYELELQCSHVAGTLYELVVRDCEKSLNLDTAKIVILGCIGTIVLVLFVLPFHLMQQKYPQFFAAFAWTVQFFFINTMFMLDTIVVTIYSFRTREKIYAIFIQRLFYPTFLFSLYAQAILFLADFYFRFKNLTYKDVLISTTGQDPLLVHDLLLSKMAKPFVKMMICWGFGVLYGCISLIIYFISSGENNYSLEIIYQVGSIILLVFLFAFILPFVAIVNMKSGAKQRQLNKAVHSHFETISTSQRSSKQTLTQFKNECAKKKTNLYCKIKEFFKIYRSSWPIVIVFGLLPFMAKLCLDALSHIGYLTEARYLKRMYTYYQYSVNGSMMPSEVESWGNEYHEEFAPQHALMLIASMWPVFNVLSIAIAITVTLFVNEYYHVFLRCYGRLFAYCIKSDIQRFFCPKKFASQKEPEIKISNDAWDRKMAFASAGKAKGSKSAMESSAESAYESAGLNPAPSQMSESKESAMN